VITAVIEPQEQSRKARLYFRSEEFPDFYYVNMVADGEGFQATLPRPNWNTSRIIYYIEAVDLAFNGSRTEEYGPTVTASADCERRDPRAAWFAGESPQIIVGAIREGVASLPPGFQAVGIAGFIASSGALSGVGGWFGVGTAVLASAGAAATTGVLVAQGGDEGTTSTVSATTSTVPPGGGTTTIPGGTATTTVPRGTTTTTVPPATTTSTAPETTTTTAIPLAACFTYEDVDGNAGCRVAFDASCSTGNIVTYHWYFADNPPATATGMTVEHDWSDDPQCGGPFSKLVRLTVTAADGDTDFLEVTINPSFQTSLVSATDPIQSSFTSALFLTTKERVEAHVVANGAQLDVTDSSKPYRHRLSGHPGRNTIEAYLTSTGEWEALWQFDFAETARFVPDSIEAERGVVLARDATSIVLRLTGAPGGAVKLSFRLEP